MVKSMTGYGGAKGEADGLKISIELKSVNNRYLDVNVRLPRSFIFLEESLKSLVGKYISRGKVDVFVSVESGISGDMEVTINEALMASYIEALTSACDKFSLDKNLDIISLAKLPDVMSLEKREMDKDLVSEKTLEIMEAALCDFNVMRANEGEKLRADIKSRVEKISAYTAIVEENAPKTVEVYRANLEQKMRDVLQSAGIDENRILLEAAIFADKVAVDEETVRLRSHMSQLAEMLNSDVAVGRKMDFLIQEFNREANTIGSKCQNVDIAHVVVDIKSEIEKIREQVQNLE